MENPTVSVVMPVYNETEYVQSAIESILAQTVDAFELIIVNDGSTDETRSIIESYDDDRIRPVHLPENRGLPSACNRGIEEARGQYVARHDADDRSHPDRFERQVAYLDAHEAVVAVGTGAVLIDEHDKTIARRRLPTHPSLRDLVAGNQFIHGSMMLRRSALEEVGGYDEWFSSAEDYDLWLRLAAEHDVRNVDELLYEYRVYSDSTYASRLEEMWLYSLLAIKRATEPSEWTRLKETVDQEGIQTVMGSLSRSERRNLHRRVAAEQLKYGRPKSARDHVRRAISLSKPNPMLYLLYSLSFAPPSVTKLTANVYRRLVLNPRLRVANALGRDGNQSLGFE